MHNSQNHNHNHVRSSAEAVFSSRPLFDDRSREKLDNPGFSFNHVPPYRVDTRNSPVGTNTSGRANVLDTSAKRHTQTGKVTLEQFGSDQAGVAFGQLFQHFDVALNQLKDLTVHSFLAPSPSPRHQLCLSPGPGPAGPHSFTSSAAKMAPNGPNPIVNLPRIESAENFEKSSGQFGQKAKSRYMWIDSLKQWVEMDSTFVPYISFIHKMQLSEPDIAHLKHEAATQKGDVSSCLRFVEHLRLFDQHKTAPLKTSAPLPPRMIRQNRGKSAHDSAQTAAVTVPVPVPFFSSKHSVASQGGPRPGPAAAAAAAAGRELGKSLMRLAAFAKDGVDSSAPAPSSSRRSTKSSYDAVFGFDNDPAETQTRTRTHSQTEEESGDATLRGKSKSGNTLGVAGDATVAGTDAGKNSTDTLRTSKLRKEDSVGANSEKEKPISHARRLNGDDSFENGSKSDLLRKAIDSKDSSRLDPSAERADPSSKKPDSSSNGADSSSKKDGPFPKVADSSQQGADSSSNRLDSSSNRAGSSSNRDGSSSKRAESSSNRAGSSSKRADSSSKRADSITQEADSTEKGAMPTVSEVSLSRSQSSFYRIGTSESDELTADADNRLIDSEKSDLGKQSSSRCESGSSYIRVGSFNQKRKDEQDKFTLLLPKVGSSAAKKRSAKPKLDKSYAEELRRQEAAELIKQKFKKMLEIESSKFKFPITGLPEEPIYDDYGWLAKYCIFNSTVLEMYRRAFDAVDERGRGWISPMECMMALKGVNSHLSNSEEKYLFRITELLGRRNRLGIDFRLFSVIAGLSQRLAALDNWMRSLIDKTDLAGLEMKMSVCLKLWEFTADEMTKKLPLEKLYVELKAGGVSPQHEQEVRHRLGWMKALDILDFLTYMPLFIMIHQSVIDNPLSDLRNK